MNTSTTETNTRHFLVIDSHEIVLEGIIPLLRTSYPGAQITTAKNIREAESILTQGSVDLIISDIKLPVDSEAPASVESGIRLIDNLMNGTNRSSILVFSANIKPLFRLQEIANSYPRGFVALSKSASVQSLIHFVGVALGGSIYLPAEVRLQAEFAPRWTQLLGLKYHDALSDRAIARTMGLSDRTIRNYWNRIQDALNIYDNPDKDIRVQIQLAAKQAGLIH